ncbi:MAG: hypothetical protein KKE44_01880 [Proteobacteria bacterium]|nr:hypothetical protein [Pseudomonadota bacterium]MBU2632054.1 hypothetical protein [Pseudomonadota bacterium]
MAMVLIFLKIFFSGICLVSLWICIKIIWGLVQPLLNTQKKLTLLKDLISADTYDHFTINRAIHAYIPPKYQENSPYEKKDQTSKNHIKKTDLTRKLDIFLDHDDSARHLLILADSGMGKTCFAINYFIHNLKRAEKEQHNIILVPLGLQKAEELILIPSDKKNSLLFLDGFDEDVKAFGNQHNRLRQLIDLSQKYRKVIITSSINFFPKDTNMAVKKGHERIGPKNPTENHYYEFKKLYLSPFNRMDIKKYMDAAFSIWEIPVKKSIRSFIKNNLIIPVNPFLLSYFKKIFHKKATIQSVNDIYEKIIENWVSHEKNWTDKSKLNQLAQKLAVDLYLRRQERGTEAIDQNELVQKAIAWGIPLYPLENNIQSLIIHTQSGVFKFTHRLIMEYLFIKQLVAGDTSCYQTVLTEQMGKFLLEILENNNPTSLKTEFNWLSQFELMAHGLTAKTSNDTPGKPADLFFAILKKNKQFEFLDLLKSLIQNPIFYEFGWDPKLNEKLKEAIFQSKSYLMKLPEKEWAVMITQNRINITKRHQKDKEILINQKDFQEYSRLSNNDPIIQINKAIGLKGLIMLNNINQSKNFCILPDLKTFQTFTLYFWAKQFN